MSPEELDHLDSAEADRQGRPVNRLEATVLPTFEVFREVAHPGAPAAARTFGDLTRSPYSSSSRDAILSRSKSRARAYAARPISVRRSGSASAWIATRASCSWFSGSTRNPLTPSRMISAKPDPLVAITGRPSAIASRHELAMLSHIEAMTT